MSDFGCWALDDLNNCLFNHLVQAVKVFFDIPEKENSSVYLKLCMNIARIENSTHKSKILLKRCYWSWSLGCFFLIFIFCLYKPVNCVNFLFDVIDKLLVLLKQVSDLKKQTIACTLQWPDTRTLTCSLLSEHVLFQQVSDMTFCNKNILSLNRSITTLHHPVILKSLVLQNKKILNTFLRL